MTDKCATIGCQHRAVTVLEMSYPKQRDEPWLDRVCAECATGYLRRPALRAREVLPVHFS